MEYCNNRRPDPRRPMYAYNNPSMMRNNMPVSYTHLICGMFLCNLSYANLFTSFNRQSGRIYYSRFTIQI